MKLKDFVTLGASLLALAVSAVTMYFDLFRVSEHAILLLDHDKPDLKFEKGGITAANYWPNMTITNNGNRPLAVLGVSWVLYQLNDPSAYDENCKFPAAQTDPNSVSMEPIAGSFAPAVIEGGKIGIMSPRFAIPRPGQRTFATGWGLGRLMLADGTSGQIIVMSCLTVKIATPEGVTHLVTRPLLLHKLYSRGAPANSPPSLIMPFANDKPIDLFDDVGRSP